MPYLMMRIITLAVIEIVDNNRFKIKFLKNEFNHFIWSRIEDIDCVEKIFVLWTHKYIMVRPDLTIF